MITLPGYRRSPVAALLFASSLLLGLAWSGACLAQAPERLPIVKLTAGIHLIEAELADDGPSRMQGLMYRQNMPANHGMAFVFDQKGVQCMWMRNTLLPLSVAFIAEDGTIVNIEDMAPQTDDTHCARKPVKYALEMNQGWFAKRGIKAGARIGGLPGATRSK